jgi:hypothetical protein
VTLDQMNVTVEPSGDGGGASVRSAVDRLARSTRTASSGGSGGWLVAICIATSTQVITRASASGR